MDFESEKFFTCPYCGSQISMLFETLYGTQSYIEDCETCCNPIQVTYEVDEEGEVMSLDVQKAQD